MVYVLLALDILIVFLPSTFLIRTHLIPGFTILFSMSKSLLCICYFSCNFACAKYSPNIITGPDSPGKIVQLSLFNHVNPSSISSDIAYTNITIYEILPSQIILIEQKKCPECHPLLKRL